jgi:hypothetical protein
MHSARASDSHGGVILYGGAKYLWILSVERALSPVWRLESLLVSGKIVHPWFELLKHR